VVARLDGYEPRHVVVQPRAGANEITVDLVAIAPTVILETQPAGAQVTIDAQLVGVTPIALLSLPAGRTVAITFTRSGYQEVTTRVAVPGPGKELRFVQPLVPR
jgi:hypothetical protein